VITLCSVIEKYNLVTLRKSCLRTLSQRVIFKPLFFQRMVMSLNGLLRVLGLIGKIIIGIVVAYAVIFSIACTAAIIIGYKAVMQPIKEVQYLVQHNPEKTIFIKQYCQEMKKKGKSETYFQVFIPFDSISKNLKTAVIAAEDDGFYMHPGFDIEAILNAYQYNRIHNKNARGASTITQQLAKNLFLTNEKTFARKFKELGYTLLLEKILAKDRIFELYLNYAQWGDSIFGCEAASQYYYKKSSTRLTLGEATHLAATLVSPERLNPRNVKSIFMQKRVETIANNLYLKHIINDSDYANMCGKNPPLDSIVPDSIVLKKMKENAEQLINAKYFGKSAQPSPNVSKKGYRVGGSKRVSSSTKGNP
jgi:monofunctional glycosyltransferase